jgi:N-acyl-L-homoserine lactone synthetase
VQRYVGVMPHWIVKHVIGAAGCPVTFLRPVSRVDGRDIVAAHIEVSSEILAAVRARGRHRLIRHWCRAFSLLREPSRHSRDSFNSANTASPDNAERCASNSLA